MSQRKLLVTGSAGAVGQTVSQALAEHGYRVRGFDRKPSRASIEHVVSDLSNLDALLDAASDVDTILHLAAVPDRQDFAHELVPNNIVGTHHVFEAARLAKVECVIYASSIRVVSLASKDSGQVMLDVGLVPADHYGVSKACGELLARMYAARFGIATLSARLGWFVRNPEEARVMDGMANGPRIYLSHRDAERFFLRAVERRPPGYAAVFVTSKNGGNSGFDLEPARALLGFEPEDSWPAGSNWSAETTFASPNFGPSLRPPRTR